MITLTEEQINAIRCAHADLSGVIQCLVHGLGTPDGIDTDAITQTIDDLEKHFGTTIDLV